MNRADFIEETLEGIATQEDLDGVELVIIDGSGDDATERLVADWRDRLPLVRYERRKPSGFDQDYCVAVECSTGDYCWLITDDDPWKPGAVTAVKRALRGTPDFVVVNGEVWGEDLTECLTKSVMAINEDREFRPGEDDALAAVALSHLTYIGAVVVRRELWISRHAESYVGTDFVHIGVLFQQPIQRSVVVVAKSCVKMRYGLASWAGRSFEIWMLKWPELVWSFPQFRPETKQAVTYRDRWRRPRQLLLMRASGLYSQQHYRKLVTGRRLRGWRRVAAYLIVSLPVLLVNRCAHRYFAWRGRLEGSLRWDLEHLPKGVR